jgi:hypothetical protein
LVYNLLSETHYRQEQLRFTQHTVQKDQLNSLTKKYFWRGFGSAAVLIFLLGWIVLLTLPRLLPLK